MAALADTGRDSRSALPFVAPALALLAAVILVPAIYVLWLSFQESTFGKAATFVGFANYAKMLRRYLLLARARQHGRVVLIVVHVELLLGLSMALLFAGGLPFRKFLIAAVLAPIRRERGRRRRDVAHPVRPRYRPDDAGSAATSVCRRSNGR